MELLWQKLRQCPKQQFMYFTAEQPLDHLNCHTPHQMDILTLIVQDIGAWSKSHKLRFQRFPMAMTRYPLLGCSSCFMGDP